MIIKRESKFPVPDGTKTAFGVQNCTLVRIWGTNGVQVPQIHPKKVKTAKKESRPKRTTFP
jgi:hypothetical protein